MPLFYLILKLWTHLFGETVLAVRSLEAILMILSVPIAYFLTKELFGKRSAYLVALFLATGPFMVRYGHEARMYALLTFLGLLSTYLLTLTVRKRLPSWLGYTLYSLTILAAVYTHYFGFLLLPGQWILVMALKDQKITLNSAWKNLKENGWLTSQIIILLAYLPWLPYAFTQFGKVEEAFWLPPVQAKTVPATFLNFSSYQGSLSFSYAITALFIALLTILLFLSYESIRHKYINCRLFLFMVCMVIFGPVLIFLVSIERSIYYDRYFICSATFYYLFLGVILAQKYRGVFRIMQLAGLVGVVILFAVGISRVDRPQYDDIGTLMSTISSLDSRNNYRVLVIDHTLYYQVAYYSHSNNPPLIYKPTSQGGYGDMSPVNSNLSLVTTGANLNGIVWVIYYENTGEELSIPSNWQKLTQTTTYNKVIAQAYQAVAYLK